MATPPAAPHPGPLPAPEPASPVHGAVVRGTDATLAWPPVEGATGYRVQVAADEGFRRLFVDTRLGPVTSLTVQNLLGDGDGTVWWRVASVSGSVAGAFSKDAEFQIAYPEARATAGPRTASVPTTGGREFLWLSVAIVISTIGVLAAFALFPGLDGLPEDVGEAQDSTRRALRAQQDTAAARLARYTARDSTGFTIPIDTAIADVVRADSARAGTVTLLPDAAR